MNNEVEMLLSGHQFRQLCEKKYAGLMDRYELRKVEIDVLYILSLRVGDDTVKQLASNNSISKAHISKAVDNLERKKLVILTEDKHDHRMHHLSLTKESEKIVDEITLIHRSFMESILGGIDTDEIEVLKRVSFKVMENIAAELKK